MGTSGMDRFRMFRCCSILPILVVLIAAAEGKQSTARLVHYSGRVQGVGFRASTATLARDYPVTGWVKNLPDGSVEMRVEGPEDAILAFLQAVRTQWQKNID